MANSYISKVKLPNDATTYYVKDEEARNSIANLGSLQFVGVTTTALTDGDTSKTTYQQLEGITLPAGKGWTEYFANGTVVIYGSSEFICTTVTSGSSTTVTWHLFGSSAPTPVKDNVLGEATTFNASSSIGGTLTNTFDAPKNGTIGFTAAAAPTIDYSDWVELPAPTFNNVVASVSTTGDTAIKSFSTANSQSTGDVAILVDSSSANAVTGVSTTEATVLTGYNAPTVKYLLTMSIPRATAKGSTTSIIPVGTEGTAASWSATVANETLSFAWTANTPTTAGTTVNNVNTGITWGATDATVATGSAGSVETSSTGTAIIYDLGTASTTSVVATATTSTGSFVTGTTKKYLHPTTWTAVKTVTGTQGSAGSMDKTYLRWNRDSAVKSLTGATVSTTVTANNNDIVPAVTDLA